MNLAVRSFSCKVDKYWGVSCEAYTVLPIADKVLQTNACVQATLRIGGSVNT